MNASIEGAVRPASTLILLRDTPAYEVLMVQRHHQIDFASGALVFPGGKAHPSDADTRWSDHVLDADDGLEQRSLRIAAIREVFEEAGLLLARDRSGRPLEIEPCPLEVRQAVDRGELPFLDVVRDYGAVLDLAALDIFARWITPPVTPKRFDTWFYVARAPEGQLAVCDGRETVDACWISPGAALADAAAGRRKLVFPTRMNLNLLAAADGAETVIDQARARPRVTVQPEVRQGPDGPMLVLPEVAGYGAVAEPFVPGM